MDPATLALIEKIITILIQAVELGIKFAPDIISTFKPTYALATSGTTLTEAQIAEAEDAMLKAHNDLQAAIASAISEDTKENANG